jgi:hypothetical protein
MWASGTAYITAVQIRDHVLQTRTHHALCNNWRSVEDAARELDRLRAHLTPGEIPCLDLAPELAVTVTGQSGRRLR